MKNLLLFCSLSLCLGTLPTQASATTLQLQSVGGASVNGIDIFPYNFSVNGSSTLTSMLCLDFNREVTLGEQWNVNASQISTGSTQTDVDYRALALIDYAISTGGQGYSTADLQFADWAIFDPTGVTSNSGYTATAATIETNALALAGNSQYTNSGFYNAFTVYSPTTSTSGWTDGIPQEFMSFNANALPSAVGPSLTPTPEPSSLALLGTGLLSVGGFVSRRIKRS